MSVLKPIHGGQLHAIAERFRVDPSTLLDFSANINPEGPPPSVLSSLRSALDDHAVLLSYPDLEERQLRQSIANYTATDPDTITVANGFVPLLEVTIRTAKIRNCLLPVPCFAEYRRVLHRFGVHITPHILTSESSFRYNTPALLKALTSGRHDALLLANPQNPSGALHARAEILDLIGEAAKAGVHVLLDEAFIDYTPAESLVGHVDNLHNLIVFRSVTKFHGVPGLRVAYAVTNGSASQRLHDALPPWAITTLASIGVAAALIDIDFANRSCELNRYRRESLRQQLTHLGIHTYPASANFLLLRLPPHIDTAALWQRLIVEHSIVLRNCSTFEALAPNHIRCAVRTESENAKLLTGLSLLLNPSENRKLTRNQGKVGHER